MKTLTSLAISLLALASFASAQWAMPDFSNFDFNGYMQQQYDLNTAMINSLMSGIMQQRGPEIQAAYQQCLSSGYYCGSFDEYALEYVSTNGFSDGGAWAMTQRRMQQNEYAAWQGVKAAEANSAAVINGWNNTYYQNQGEMGNILMGNNTWINPNNANYQLPYTLQPDSYYYDQASQQQFWYDSYGQYHQLNPDGGWWQPLNPWQAGQ